MPSVLLYSIVLIIIFTASVVLVQGLRTRGSIARSLNMACFSVQVPADKSDHQLSEAMKNLFSSLNNLHVRGWNKYLYGNPYISLEMVSGRVQGKADFYVSAPQMYSGILKNKIEQFFPGSRLEGTDPEKEFFNESEFAGASVVFKKRQPNKIRTTKILHGDLIHEFIVAMSKLNKQNEELIVQILIKPAEFGKKDVFNGNFFETNIRLAALSAGMKRSEKIIENLIRVFSDFRSHGVSQFQVNRVKRPAVGWFRNDFMYKIFDDKEKTLVESEELSHLFHFIGSIKPKMIMHERLRG